jgi:Fe2+ transport system protein FeoA
MLNSHFLRNTALINPVLKSGSDCPNNLSQAPSGKEVTIKGYGNLPAASLRHLQAYGILPGRSVRVLAQKPVTIILVEQTELAFETEIAAQVFVE